MKIIKEDYTCLKDTESLNYKNLLVRMCYQDLFDNGLFTAIYDTERAEATVMDSNLETIKLVVADMNIIHVFEDGTLIRTMQLIRDISGEYAWRIL